MRTTLVSIAVLTMACSAQPASTSATQSRPPARLESDPHFYKLNSVMGNVTAGGKAVPGAQITVAKANKTFAVEPTGSYVIELDPAQYGGFSHQLIYSAPGYRDEMRRVLIRENNQVRVDVELTPAP